MTKKPVRRISWLDQEGKDIDDAAEAAGVNGVHVKHWLEHHPEWTLEQAIAKFRNAKEQAERRASHDTGYQRRGRP